MFTNFGIGTLASSWRNKVRRRFYSPYNKVVHRGRYFICRYFGAAFLVRSTNVGGLEISAKIAEHDELKNFMRDAAVIKPARRQSRALHLYPHEKSAGAARDPVRARSPQSR